MSGKKTQERRRETKREERISLVIAGVRERSNDDYCRASSIYSPTAFAIIGELPLVNCSRYAVHRGPRIKTSLLPGHGSSRARERERGRMREGEGERAAVLAVLLVINFAPVANYRREPRAANARPRRSRRITGNRKGSLVMITR